MVGTGTLNASGHASTTTGSLPAGTDNLYAVYGGDTHFSGSTSPVRFQTVIGLPSVCASGGYGTYIFGNPGFPFINGTNGNDFIYAFGGSYWVNGYGATTVSTLVTGTTFCSTATGTTVCLRATGRTASSWATAMTR